MPDAASNFKGIAVPNLPTVAACPNGGLRCGCLIGSRNQRLCAQFAAARSSETVVRLGLREHDLGEAFSGRRPVVTPNLPGGHDRAND